MNAGKIFPNNELQAPNFSNSKRSNLHYQAIQLSKVMEARSHKGHTFQGLKYANGLIPIRPETSFEASMLTDLFYEENLPTKCEFLIVIAMYNESAEHFTNSLKGVNENLNEFVQAGIDPNKIACIVLVDGILPFMQTFSSQRSFFEQFFDENFIKDRFNVSNIEDCTIPEQTESDEFAHCFMQKVSFGSSQYPLKFIMCVKQQNKRKLNTHLWFFGGFCEMIQPKFVMLLDVGTKPLAGSLFYFYEAMECDTQLAGCCGEIKPMDFNIWKAVVPAQFVEYKFFHILDKALESIIGYITVLPGAFSAYRWEALQGAPLWEDYFKSICHPELMDAFNSNIYLAEDRVLCLSLISKRGHNYTLRYVKSSIAETDVPDSIAILMAQRRRWINGCWFALVDAICKCKNIHESSHSRCRKLMFTIQMIYYCLNVIYHWFIVGGFCLAVVVAIRRNNNSNSGYPYVGDALILIYISILIIIFIASIAVKPKRVEDFYKLMALILAAYEIYLFYLIGCFLVEEGTNRDGAETMLAVTGMIACFALIALLNWEIWTICKGSLHYILLIPTYVNIFIIYSICNVHDCTWGNRPDSLSAYEKERLEEFEEFRMRCAIVWVLCNSGFAYGMSALDADNIYSFAFLTAFAGAGIFLLFIRVIGGVIYIFIESCKKKLPVNKNIPQNTKLIRRASCKVIQQMRSLNEVEEDDPEVTAKKNNMEVPIVGQLNSTVLEIKIDNEESSQFNEEAKEEKLKENTEGDEKRKHKEHKGEEKRRHSERKDGKRKRKSSKRGEAEKLVSGMENKNDEEKSRQQRLDRLEGAPAVLKPDPKRRNTLEIDKMAMI